MISTRVTRDYSSSFVIINVVAFALSLFLDSCDNGLVHGVDHVYHELELWPWPWPHRYRDDAIAMGPVV